MTNVDIFLYPSAYPIVDIILSYPSIARQLILGRDDRPADRSKPRRRPPPIPVPTPVVVAHSLFDDLVGRYGKEQGRRIYFEMQAEYKGPFAPGAKYDATRRKVPPLTTRPQPRAPVITVPPARRN